MKSEQEKKNSLLVLGRVLPIASILIALFALFLYWLYLPPFAVPPPINKLTTNRAIDTQFKAEVPNRILEPSVSEEAKVNQVSHGTVRFLENINCYINSPARDTPQCRAIADLLSRHDLGPDSVKDAYNLAWHAYSLADRIELEADLRKVSLEFVNNFYIEGLVFGFTIKYAVTNVNLFKELLAVRPTVHFGHCGFAHQTKGTLTEKLAELTNPDLFPEFKLNSNWLSQGIEAAEAHFQLFANQEAESSFFHEPEVEPMRYLLTDYGVPSHHFPELLRYAVEMTSSYSTFNAHVQHDRKRLDELATSGEPSGDEELRINRFSAERSLQNSISNAETFKQESITEWMNNTGMTDGRFFEKLFSIIITSSIPRLPIVTDLSPELEQLVRSQPVPRRKIEIPIQQLPSPLP